MDNPNLNEKSPRAFDSKLMLFGAGLSIGLTVGFLVGYERQTQNTSIRSYVVQSDLNNDNIPDSWAYYDYGSLVKIESDRNYDGRPDSWEFFLKGVIVRAELDDDFDGKPDSWLNYNSGVLETSSHDTDGNGKPDNFGYYSHGVIALAAWRENESTRVSRMQIFNELTKSCEYHGLNEEEKFTNCTYFDSFENAATQKALANPMSPKQLLDEVLAKTLK